MRFYPSMVAPSHGDQSWHLSVNASGQYVIQPLGSDGNPCGFVTGDSVKQLVEELARKVCPYARITWNDANFDGLVQTLSSDGCCTWDDLAVELQNYHAHQRKTAKYRDIRDTWRGLMYSWCHSRNWVRSFIQFANDTFSLTQAAKDWDAKHYPESNKGRGAT